MRSFLLATLSLLAFAVVLAVYAGNPVQQKDAPPQITLGKDGQPLLDAKSLAKVEKELGDKYSAFEKSLLTLCQRLANGDDKDKARAAQLQKVLDTASGFGITGKFTQFVKFLGQQQLGNTAEIDEAVRQSVALARDLKEILDLLRNDSGAGSKREERIALEKFLKELDRVIRDQKLVRSQIPLNPDKDAVGNEQKDVTQNTADLKNKLPGKPGEGEPKDSKGESKDPGKGDKAQVKNQGSPEEPKTSPPSAGSSKPGGDGKGQGSAKSGGGEPSDKSPMPAAESKSDNQSPPKAGSEPKDDMSRAKKKIEEANAHQKSAEDHIAKSKKDDAGKDADKAIDTLESLKKNLEKLLRQLREEELERVLANLISRCQKMLALQEEVLRGTLRVQSMIEAAPNKKADRDSIQASLILSDDELKIVQEATKAIEILETEGSAVAFPEVFQQVREDMKHVQRRLKNTDAGDVTMTIEQDIIDTLKEMIKALEKAKQEIDNKKNQPKPKDGEKPPQQEQKLLNKIAELKLIRSMQLQVNGRTELYGKRYQGEQAMTEEIRLELRELANRQERIVEVTQKVAKGG